MLALKGLQGWIDDGLVAVASRNSKLTNFGLASKIRAIVEMVAEGLEDMELIARDVERNIFPHLADSDSLDKHAFEIGLERKQGTKSTGKVRVGSTSVPAGTKTFPVNTVVTTTGTSQEQAWRYKTLSQATISNTTPIDGEGYYTVEVDAEAMEIGFNYNIPPETINRIEPYVEGFDVAYNPSAFVDGTDKETDPELAVRIRNAWRSTDRGTKPWYEVSAEDFDGVVKAVCVPEARGPNTVDVVLVGDDGVPSDTVVNEVQAFFDDVDEHIVNADVLVRKADLVFIDQTYIITKTGTVTESEMTAYLQDAFEDHIQGDIVEGVPGLTLGDDVVQAVIMARLALENGVGDIDMNATAALIEGVNTETFDLTTNFFIKLSIDGSAYQTIDCRGANPALTTAAEVAFAINSVFPGVAVDDSGAVNIQSLTIGSASKVTLGIPASGDATEIIFGISKGITQTYTGSDVDNNIIIGDSELAFPGRLTLIYV